VIQIVLPRTRNPKLLQNLDLSRVHLQLKLLHLQRKRLILVALLLESAFFFAGVAVLAAGVPGLDPGFTTVLGFSSSEELSESLLLESAFFFAGVHLQRKRLILVAVIQIVLPRMKSKLLQLKLQNQ
jgi:hypothetical protein